MAMLNKRKDKLFYFLLYLFFALVCACFIIPLLVVISASFTSENELLSGGFSLFPKEFTTAAYQSAFKNSEKRFAHIWSRLQNPLAVHS